MGVTCWILGHAAADEGRWNEGYYFAKCKRCRCDLIRTSGEKRLSNFLLWQAAYAELLFVDTLWPDFDGDALRAALAEYEKRERRSGGL